MKNVIVTGGAGMIGSNLCSKLLDLEYNVTVIDDLWRGKLENLKYTCGQNYSKIKFFNYDLSVKSDWIDLFNSCDIVFHLADVVAGIGFVFANESFIFNKNLLINANVSEAVKANSIKRYIYVGTACSFPKDLQNNVDGKPLEEIQQFPADPESAYGWSKLMGELDCAFLNSSGFCDTVTLVLHNVYGSPCDYKSEKSQVIPSLINKALDSHLNDFKLDVWGNGEQGRAFVHVDDVVDALISSIDFGHNCGPIQIGPSICTRIKEIINIIRSFFNYEIFINYQTDKPVGDVGRCANFTKAKNELNWEPKVSLNHGLFQLLEWVKKDSSR
jgi:GDP-D-mannose 3',5'-epimerase